MKRRRGERGFVLLDAMIAMAIVALVGMMFVQTLQGSNMAQRRVTLMREATLIARSQLALAQEGAATRAMSSNSRLTWQVSDEPVEGTPGGPGLLAIIVTVFDRGTGRPLVVLHSLRLAR